MKKVIQILTIVLLSLTIIIIIIFLFNPFSFRDKIISSMINYYFNVDKIDVQENNDTEATSSKANLKTPAIFQNEGVGSFLSEDQKSRLENIGVNIESLPNKVSPEMSACFIEKIGENRIKALVAGASPSPLEILKSKECLSK